MILIILGCLILVLSIILSPAEKEIVNRNMSIVNLIQTLKPVSSLVIGSQSTHNGINCMYIKPNNILQQVCTLAQILKPDRKQSHLQPFKFRNFFDLITIQDNDLTFPCKQLLSICKLLLKTNKSICVQTKQIFTDVPKDFKVIYASNDENYVHLVNLYTSQQKTCCSELLTNILYENINIDPIQSKVKYYSMSFEREIEIRKAYENDVSFKVINVTSFFHACILTCIFPLISIQCRQICDRNQELYSDCMTFYNKFISK